MEEIPKISIGEILIVPSHPPHLPEQLPRISTELNPPPRRDIDF